MKEKLNNVLIISGTGRNSGKTTVACQLIRHFSKGYRVVSVKISPHQHKRGKENLIIEQKDNYTVFEETDHHTGKDSSKMLKAGASRCFYIQAADPYVEEAFLQVYHKFPEETPIICESPALPAYIHPGALIITDHAGVHPKKEQVLSMLPRADALIDISQTDPEEYLKMLDFSGTAWNSKSNNTG